MDTTSTCGTPPILCCSIWCMAWVPTLLASACASAGAAAWMSLLTLSSTRRAAVMLCAVFSASSSDRLSADGASRLDVAERIADEGDIGQLHIEACGDLQQQPRTWLAAIAAIIGAMRTEGDQFDAPALGLHVLA